ncbi:hypothetical protein C8A00DRAFT_13533 [Chaetomidium leptoderma]|uniref:Uncharacterized protein n=1 Tax=Chaetomidium leptoderma TaxID=669021 RepID=A0AAN6ZZ11_9PEZI|nr:hypothetical protein C8A00DRAFT_13533 [Chaetomidium leptoderma]
MATSTTLRYSNPNVSTSVSAEQFPWESGVPVNKFWKGISWMVCIHFLGNFTTEELLILPIDAAITAGLNNKEKIQLLLKILQDRSSGGAIPVNSKAWNRLMYAIFILQKELRLTQEAGRSIRALVAAEEGSPSIVMKQALAHQLIDEWKFTEAEGLIRPACDEIDATSVGRNSPQGIGYRRTLLEAIWKQGVERRDEAFEMEEEIIARIEGMAGGEFAVYVDAEREELRNLMGDLAFKKLAC